MPDESRVLRIGDWRVDPELDELSREGRTIRVEPRTMQLLLYLAARAGRVIDVQQLLDTVWSNVVVTQGSVYQAVAELRRILGDDREHPTYIENLPRRGYRLIAPVAPWNAGNSAAPSDSTAVGSSPLTSAPIPAEVQSVSASPDRHADTGTEAVAAARPLAPRRLRRSAVLGGIALAAVIVAGIALDAFWRVHHMPVTGVRVAGTTEVPVTPATFAPPPHSIAVLPFVDMSEKHDQEYFGDGMAEEILDYLAKIPQLTVIGRTSSFQFKGRTEDLRTIGEKLGVAYIVEGSIRRVGSRIRVTAQLIDARSRAHVWSDSYDRDYGDVLVLQDEIATAVARALQLSIGAQGARPLLSAQSLEAYTLYLKGKLALDKFEARSLLEAQNSFQQALVLDPTLLAAAEGLAETYLQRGALESDISSREAWGEAKAAAETALRMDSRSAVAYGVLGFVAGQRDFEWTKAESEFRRALALNPNDPDILANAAQISGMHGDFEECLHRLNASLMLDPLNAATNQSLGGALYCQGDYSGAEAAYRKSISFDPRIVGSHYHIGLIQLAEGRPNEALKEFEADPEISIRDVGISLVTHALGRKAESDAALVRLVNESGKTWPYGVALVHAYRGERDLAFDWLEKAYAASDIDLVFVLCDPYLVPLHDDPRWLALMKKMNLGK